MDREHLYKLKWQFLGWQTFLKASHITCTHQAYQITVCSLYILLQRAYSEQGQNGISVDHWWTDSAATSSHAQF